MFNYLKIILDFEEIKNLFESDCKIKDEGTWKPNELLFA